MAETLKQKVERANGDEFVAWYNQSHSLNFQFHRLGGDPPDLIYRDGERELPLEVTTAYYNNAVARMLWGGARKDPNAPTKAHGTEPDKSLVDDISRAISEKCLSDQDPKTILFVGFHPSLTTREEFEELRRGIIVPNRVPYAEIFTGGSFGVIPGPAGAFYWKVF